MFRGAAVLLGVAALCVAVVGLPLSDPGGHVQQETGEPLRDVWALSWESRSLLDDPGDLYDGNAYWPAPTSVAYAESMAPLVPVFAALRLVTGDDLKANLLLVHLLVLAAVAGAFLLARRFVRSDGAALLAGLSYGLGGFVVAHVADLPLLTLGSVPLVFLLWFRALEGRRWTTAVGCGVALAAASLASLAYALVLAPCLVAMALVHRRDARVMALVFAVAVVGVLPGVLPYRLLESRQSLAVPVDRSDVELPAFVVLALAAAAVAGRFRRSRRRHELVQLGVAGLVGVVLAVGPPFELLHDRLQGYRSVGDPSLLVVPSLLLVAVVAAVGLDALSARSRLVVPLAVAVLAVELWSPVRWVPVDDDVAVYRLLDDLPSGPVVELPMAPPFPYAEGPALAWDETEPTRMLHSLIDENPRVNGFGVHHPVGYFELVFDLNRFPTEPALARIDELGVRYVIVHATTEPDVPAGWDARQAGAAWLLTVPG